MFSIFFITQFFKSIFNLTKQRYESKFTIMGNLFPIYEFKFTIMESLLPRQTLKKLPRRHPNTIYRPVPAFQWGPTPVKFASLLIDMNFTGAQRSSDNGIYDLLQQAEGTKLKFKKTAC